MYPRAVSLKEGKSTTCMTMLLVSLVFILSTWKRNLGARQGWNGDLNYGVLNHRASPIHYNYEKHVEA